LIRSDFFQQKPKLNINLSNEEKFISEYESGKDVYATIAFNVPYEECLEFRPSDGSLKKEGKERRNQAKSILLGICYGRSIPTIAEQLKCTEKKHNKYIMQS